MFGSLVASRLVDELFLTVSPVLAGRGATARLGLVEGVELVPADPRRRPAPLGADERLAPVPPLRAALSADLRRMP